jgi:hypothetical protein
MILSIASVEMTLLWRSGAVFERSGVRAERCSSGAVFERSGVRRG